MRRDDWTKILGWPGYTVFQQEIDERAKTLKLWVRRKRGNRRHLIRGQDVMPTAFAHRADVYQIDVYQIEVCLCPGEPSSKFSVSKLRKDEGSFTNETQKPVQNFHVCSGRAGPVRSRVCAGHALTLHTNSHNCPPGGLVAGFDISWVDSANQRYYLADRGATPKAGAKNTARIIVIDTQKNQYLYSIPSSSAETGFTGPSPAGAPCNQGGPDGVVAIPQLNQLYVGDGNSTVKVVDLGAKAIVATISTGGKCRADEPGLRPPRSHRHDRQPQR